MLGGLFSMKGNTLFSGPFGTGIGGDFLGVSNSPQMDPLHLFATNQPGGANYDAAHPGLLPPPAGTPMPTGMDPSMQPMLQQAYMNYLRQLNPGMYASMNPQPQPQTPPQGNMQGLAALARLQAGGGLNGFRSPQYGPNPMSGFRPQPQ